MAKKQKCPEFENHERWLVAFADMMTLLFALFVVLYAIANADKSKATAVAESVQKALGIPPDVKGNSRVEGIFDKVKGNTRRETLTTRNRRERIQIINEDVKSLRQKIEDRLYGDKQFPSGKQAEGNQDKVVFVSAVADGIRVTLLARKFFQPNQTTIEPEAKVALDVVAQNIKGLNRIVRVEGHTDNQPFSMKGMTNWELSAARAASVVRYLIENHGYNPQMIYAAGFGDSQPIAPNDTPLNRSMNRRVDLKILYDSLKLEAPDGRPEEQTEETEPIPASELPNPTP